MKTIMRYHLTPVRMAKINNTGNSKAAEKQESFCIVGGKANRCSHSGEQYGQFLKKLKFYKFLLRNVWQFLKKLPYDPTIILLGIYPRDTEIKI